MNVNEFTVAHFNIHYQCDFCHTTYFEPFVSLKIKFIKETFQVL